MADLIKELRRLAVNARGRDVILKILANTEGQAACVKLSKAKLIGGKTATLNDVFEVVQIAALPAVHFINPLIDDEARFNDIARHASELNRLLKITNPQLLQNRADRATNFATTGQVWQANVLVAEITPLLKMLVELSNPTLLSAGFMHLKSRLMPSGRDCEPKQSF